MRTSYTYKELESMSVSELEEIKAAANVELDLQSAGEMTLKVLINSIYGTFANKHSPFYDIDAASSITLTGQACVKQSSIILNQYAKDTYGIVDDLTIYQDTDSVVGDTLISTNYGDIKIEDLFDEFNSNTTTTHHGHELAPCTELKALTYNSTTNQTYMGEVKNIIRHRVSKEKYKIVADGKEIIMTEDHGCMVKRDNELMRVSPSDIRPTDKLIVF